MYYYVLYVFSVCLNIFKLANLFLYYTALSVLFCVNKVIIIVQVAVIYFPYSGDSGI